MAKHSFEFKKKVVLDYLYGKDGTKYLSKKYELGSTSQLRKWIHAYKAFGDEEIIELSRCKNFTLNKGTGRGSNIKYNPYAFTEQGVYMLMTVLKGELAIRQSRALVRMFKQMKDYLIENRDFITVKEFAQIAVQTNQNTQDIATINKQISTLATKTDLKKVMDHFIDPDTYKHFLLMNGEKIEADLAYTKIYQSAKKRIYVVDNYMVNCKD